MSETPKLTYAHGRGLAELSRLIFAVKSIEIKEEYINTKDDFTNLKTKKDWHHLFTDDPDKLEGQRLKTSLFKSRQGFGFTIIGGDEADEFLQIKSILPDGPAFEDGKLKTGDVLIFVNDKKVLGSTHQDVVSLFQTITPGEKVTLEVCRGYPLPFDPSDPNTNNVTTYGRSGSMENFRNHHNGSDGDSPSYHGPGDTRRHGPRKRKDDNHLKNSNAKSLPDLTRQVQTDIDHRAKTPTPSMNLHYPDNGSTPHFAKPETIVVEFEKGPDGFGFTVADSPYGQKIKQLFVPQRSQGLQEEDILVEINNRNIQSLPHKEVVNCLKDCPQGAKARIVVLRGAGKLMFQQIPLLEIDGLCLAESTAQANYLGLKYNMLGGTDKEKARVQMLFSGAKSFFTSCTPSWNFYAPERKEEMVKAAINSAKSRYLPAFEKALEDNGTSFLVGSSPTIADCALYDILTYFEMPEYGDLLADSPLCKAFLTKFASIPGVKEYLNSPRRFPPPDVELVEWVKATLYL